MKRTCLSAVFVLLVTLLCQAHEFWLLPARFWASVGQTLPVEVLVGEHFNGERSEGKKNRIVQYAHYVGKTKEDLSPQLTEGHYGMVPLKLTTAGTHLVAFFNTNKYLEMRADSFLLYLEEDGLNSVIKQRQQRGETQTRSREFYRRCAKTLIQAGSVVSQDQTFALETGLPLEIIPRQNPYSLKPGQQATFRVLFEHKPLANVLVRYWTRPVGTAVVPQNAKPPGLTEERQQTNALGEVRFRLKAGQNMVSLVHMVPYADLQQADWQSYWGSLTFGCR